MDLVTQIEILLELLLRRREKNNTSERKLMNVLLLHIEPKQKHLQRLLMNGDEQEKLSTYRESSIAFGRPASDPRRSKVLIAKK